MGFTASNIDSSDSPAKGHPAPDSAEGATLLGTVSAVVPIPADWTDGEVVVRHRTASRTGESPTPDAEVEASPPPEVPERWLRDLLNQEPQTSAKWQEATREMPEVGERFLDFILEEEIGRGAFGRVFLARQGDLAGRLVALKVSVDLGGEIHNLAQLQHTNIMPIYSAHRSQHLHAVCMPFFGRSTLADLCRQIQLRHTLPESGQFVRSTLRDLGSETTRKHSSRASSAGSVHSEPSPSADDQAKIDPAPSIPGIPAPIQAGSGVFTEHSSYVDSVLWMAARLAEGLAHAHDRGILHRDLKPANILLTPEGTPMLLDFNLAEDTKQRQTRSVKMAGTLPYMSPEQMAAFGGATVGPLDARSDVYALGLIVFQLLTGRMAHPLHRGRIREALPHMLADRRCGVPSPMLFNPAVTPAVDAIVRKCLQPDPDDRYPSARALMEDIELHRANRPLRHIPEPSLTERAAKWARRHPRIASPASMLALAAAAGLAVTGVIVWQSLERRKAEYVGLQRESLAMEERFDSERLIAEQYLSCQNENPRWLETGVEHGLSALREVAALDNPGWKDTPRVTALAPERRDHLQTRVADLAFLLARANSGRPAGAPETSERLRELQTVLNSPGLMSGREQFLLATDMQANGRYRESKRLLLEITAEQPGDSGAWFMLGRAHQMLGESADALQAYGRAITLKPKFAPGYVNRAIVADSMQNWTQARADAEMAVRLEPNLYSARILRAIVLVRLNLRQEALDDLSDLLRNDEAPVRAWFLRANVRESLGDAAGAKKDRDHGMELPVRDAEGFVARGIARLRTEPRLAMQDFESAAVLNPHAVEPAQNQAYLEGEVFKRPEKAVEIIDRLLERHPDYLPALCSRGVYLARLGRAEEAVKSAERALKLSDTPFAWYRAACVHAILAKAGKEHEKTAMALIARSLRSGYGFQYLNTDDDLDPIRSAPEFVRLLDYSRLLTSLLQSPTAPR